VRCSQGRGAQNWHTERDLWRGQSIQAVHSDLEEEHHNRSDQKNLAKTHDREPMQSVHSVEGLQRSGNQKNGFAQMRPDAMWELPRSRPQRDNYLIDK